MSLIKRKPVFGVCDQVRHKLACSPTEASQSHEIANIETRDIIHHNLFIALLLV